MIDKALQGELHAYIGGCIRGMGAKPIIVGGVEDHVHILVALRGNHAVGDLVREVKKATNSWMKQQNGAFSWQEGYGAFSVSPGDIPRTTAYIENQEEHHRALSSADELRTLMEEFGIEFDDRFFE